MDNITKMIEAPQTMFVNLLLVGDKGVGKTSLIQKYLETSCNLPYARPPATWKDPSEPIAPQGVQISSDYFLEDGTLMKIYLWDADIASKDDLQKPYLHHMDAVLMVFDGKNRNSFLHLGGWYVEVMKHLPNAIKFIAGTHYEVFDASDVISVEEVRDFSDMLGVATMATSCRTGFCVLDTFVYVIHEVKRFKLRGDVSARHEAAEEVSQGNRGPKDDAKPTPEANSSPSARPLADDSSAVAFSLQGPINVSPPFAPRGTILEMPEIRRKN